MLNLIVKGDRFDAARAATAHKVPAMFVREIRPSFDHAGRLTVNTVLHVHDRFEPDVASWYVEDMNDGEFPKGSVLLYNPLEVL